MAEIKYDIVEELGVLSTGNWALELNLISWNGAAAKYDLRKWTDGHERMSKGVTFSVEEAKALRDLLNEIL